MFTMWNDGIFWGSGVDPHERHVVRKFVFALCDRPVVAHGESLWSGPLKVICTGNVIANKP